MGSTITIEIPDAIKLAMRRRSGRPYMTALALVSPSLRIVAVSGHGGEAIMPAPGRDSHRTFSVLDPSDLLHQSLGKSLGHGDVHPEPGGHYRLVRPIHPVAGCLDEGAAGDVEVRRAGMVECGLIDVPNSLEVRVDDRHRSGWLRLSRHKAPQVLAAGDYGFDVHRSYHVRGRVPVDRREGLR